jgi:hypothetical protein
MDGRSEILEHGRRPVLGAPEGRVAQVGSLSYGPGPSGAALPRSRERGEANPRVLGRCSSLRPNPLASTRREDNEENSDRVASREARDSLGCCTAAGIDSKSVRTWSGDDPQNKRQ